MNHTQNCIEAVYGSVLSALDGIHAALLGPLPDDVREALVSVDSDLRRVRDAAISAHMSIDPTE